MQSPIKPFNALCVFHKTAAGACSVLTYFRPSFDVKGCTLQTKILLSFVPIRLPAMVKTGRFTKPPEGTLQMKYNQKGNVNLTKSTTFQGKVCVGNITAKQLETLDQTLPKVPLPSCPLRVPPGYRRRDCQDWVRDAVKALIEAGVLTEQANEVLDTIPTK
jgi:hypothetical protein